MIGVMAGNADPWAVQEFFELFKTPWEPWRPGRHYRVVLAAFPGAEPAAEPWDCELAVVYGLEPKDLGGEGRQDAPQVRLIRYREQSLPVYGGCSSLAGPGRAVLMRDDTGEAVGLESDGTVGRTVRIGYDLFGEVGFLLSRGQPVEQARVPTLDLHIGILRELIVGCGLPLVEVPAVPAGHELIVCLTHDVDFVSLRAYGLDRTLLGFLYRATLGSLLRFLRGELAFYVLLRNLLGALSLPLIHLGMVRDFFNQFGRYLELEGPLRSTFFLIPCKNVNGLPLGGRESAGRATRYDVEDIPGEIARLKAKGCEVGLHGLDAWHDPASAVRERARIREILGRDPEGVRMHWLFWSEHTPQALEQAGFAYDSTWGYNEAAGFRAGTAQAFMPAGTRRLLELPLQVQDTALFAAARMNLSQTDGVALIEEIAGRVRESGGAFTVNWHMRSLGPERLWEDPYRYLLRLAGSGGVWAATAGEVVRWFALRRSVAFSEVEPGRMRASAVGDGSLPPLALRRYASARGGSSREGEELAWSESLEFAV